MPPVIGQRYLIAFTVAHFQLFCKQSFVVYGADYYRGTEFAF